MNHSSFAPRCAALLASLALLLGTFNIAEGCLTANIDKRAVQWSTSIVQAKLTDLGTRMDLPATGAPATRPSGRPAAIAYRILSFEVTQSIDGLDQVGDVVKVVALIGGQPGDGICPAMLPDSVGKKFVLLLRPFQTTSLDVPDNTFLSVGHGAMVIVSQIGEADMNADTITDLKTFVSKIRSATPTSSDQLAAQVDAVAAAHDQTEAEEAEKAITEIGPTAVQSLESRMKTANPAGRTRLRHLIADLSPPALSAEPE